MNSPAVASTLTFTSAASAETIVVRVSSANGGKPSSAAGTAAKKIIESRLSSAGIPVTSVTASSPARYTVKLPASPADAKSRLKSALRARTYSGMYAVLGSQDAASPSPSPIEGASGLTAAQRAQLQSATCASLLVAPLHLGSDIVLCHRSMKYLLSPVHISAQSYSSVHSSGSIVDITLNASGRKKLASLTAHLLRQTDPRDVLALVSGNEVITVAAVEARITTGALDIAGAANSASIADQIDFYAQRTQFKVS